MELILHWLEFDHFLVDNSRGIVSHRKVESRRRRYLFQLMVYQVRESQQQVGFWTIFEKMCGWSRSGPTCVYISVFKWRRFLKKIGKKSLCQLFFDVPLQWFYCVAYYFGFVDTFYLVILKSWNHFLPNFFLLWSLDHKIRSCLIP